MLGLCIGRNHRGFQSIKTPNWHDSVEAASTAKNNEGKKGGEKKKKKKKKKKRQRTAANGRWKVQRTLVLKTIQFQVPRTANETVRSLTASSIPLNMTVKMQNLFSLSHLTRACQPLRHPARAV